MCTPTSSGSWAIWKTFRTACESPRFFFRSTGSIVKIDSPAILNVEQLVRPGERTKIYRGCGGCGDALLSNSTIGLHNKTEEKEALSFLLRIETRQACRVSTPAEFPRELSRFVFFFPTIRQRKKGETPSYLSIFFFSFPYPFFLFFFVSLHLFSFPVEKLTLRQLRNILITHTRTNA